MKPTLTAITDSGSSGEPRTPETDPVGTTSAMLRVKVDDCQFLGHGHAARPAATINSRRVCTHQGRPAGNAALIGPGVLR